MKRCKINKPYNVLLFVLVSLSVFSCSFLNVKAATKTVSESLQSLALYSEQAYIYNLETETAIYEKDSDIPSSPASLTKLVTALVVREYVSDEELSQSVIIAREMLKGLTEAQATVNGLRENDEVTINDLLKGMLIQSGADSSNALASYIETKTGRPFSELMNEKAKSLGTLHSNFVNAHGLDDDKQYTTPSDMYRIARAFLQDPVLAGIMSSYSDQMSVKGPYARTISVKGSLLVMNPESDMHVPEVIWGKTGYTKQAQRCVVAYMKHDDFSFIVVLMKAPIPLIQYHHATNHDLKLLAATLFHDYKILDVSSMVDLPVTRPLRQGKHLNTIQLELMREPKLFVSRDAEMEDITVAYHVPEEITAPIQQGTSLGLLKLYVKGKEAASIPLISPFAYESVYDIPLLQALNDYWFVFLAILIFYQMYVTRRMNKTTEFRPRTKAFKDYYNSSDKNNEQSHKA